MTIAVGTDVWYWDNASGSPVKSPARVTVIHSESCADLKVSPDGPETYDKTSVNKKADPVTYPYWEEKPAKREEEKPAT